MMARIYADTGRYGESLAAARTATRLQPNSELSRQGQDAAAALFAQLFLGPKGDDLPPVDALGMFYEYRELTPIGRRGDEMIRRLADRLVAVDLLDQASELLQYQVDHRLEGAARAQVAARLAMVYLTNRKPDRAIAALRTTRIADLSGELRQQRLLLEARAQSDVGRHDLALDIISNINGREAIRLRSDIYWASRRWREASEQIELYYADRWRDFKPLNPVEKGDVIRAVVGYALAEDAIGLARFREKYAPLMSGDADRAAFETASKPAAANSAEFGADRQDGGQRRYARRLPARNEDPLPGRDRAGDAAAGRRRRPIRSRPARCRGSSDVKAGRRGEIERRPVAVHPLDRRAPTRQPASIQRPRGNRRHEQARQDRSRTDCDGESGAEGSRRLPGRHRHFRAAGRRLLGIPRQRPMRRPWQNPAIPNASRCWSRSATTSASNMM